MKFKIDQNLPIEAADLLTAAGHDALSVYQKISLQHGDVK